MAYTEMMKRIMSAGIDEYFALLDEEHEMSREEQFVLERRALGLYHNARTDSDDRERWNAAAKRTSREDRMF